MNPKLKPLNDFLNKIDGTIITRTVIAIIVLVLSPIIAIGYILGIIGITKNDS